MIVQDGNQRAAKDSQDEAEQALVQLYVRESGAAQCRQVVLDKYLDRREVERSGCKEEEEKYNVCRGEEPEEDSKQPSDSEQPSDNKQPSDVEIGVEESNKESRREETQREFKQQQQERQGPR
jgi:hypothetical protein